MKQENSNLLSVRRAAQEANVSEETIRRWIRSKKLHASVIGKSFYIDPWQLKTLLTMGQNPLTDEFSLLIAAMGLPSAMDGAILFDNAYFSLETQFQRIQEDKINLEAGLLRQKKEFERDRIARHEWLERLHNNVDKKTEKLPDMPAIQTYNHYWLIPSKTLFVDIHFYFVSGALIALAVRKLQRDVNDPELNEIVSKYAQSLKNLNDARNNIEHENKEMERGVFELGNISSDGRYHFDGKYYDLHVEEIRQLRDELCDYLLRKAQASLKQNK